MLTENDIKLHTFYGVPGGRARVSAFTWEDGPEGVNYEIEGLCTMLPMFTDKATFLGMANNTQIAPLAFADAERRYAVPAGSTINIDAQTDEQRDFLFAVRRMAEDQ